MKHRVTFQTILVLVALLIIGCGNRFVKRAVFSSGINYCSNPKLGEFDVTLVRDKNNPGFFAFRINTLNTTQYGGQYVRVAIANADLQFEELVFNSLASQGATLYEGHLSPVQLQKYNLLVIAPYRGGQTSIMSSSSENDEAICQLPTTDNSSANTPVRMF